jgi:hypothetical protein
VAFWFSGEARFRVRGARIIRWESVRVPFPRVSGVKILEEVPRGAEGLEGFPLPGSFSSEVVAMEPIMFLKLYSTEGNQSLKNEAIHKPPNKNKMGRKYF